MQVSGLEKRLANLRPYQHGENGHTRKAAERARLESEIIAELGADLTASDRLELRHAIELLTRRPRNHVDAVRCSNAGSRIIAKVRTRIKQREAQAPPPPRLSAAADPAAQALEHLLNKKPLGGV
jgi:DNA-directed RNA polymerase subunit RPC12/RpoP